MDIFGKRKKFLKSLKQGQIIRHRGLFTNIYELMEFGHYDEQEDRVYFQRAKVVAGNYSESDGVVKIAKVSKSGDPYIYEQIADDNKGGSYSLASFDEIERFEDAYDKQLLKFYLADDGSMDGVGAYIRERTDGRLTRLALASDPPRYLYIKTERGECVIMEFERISPVVNMGYGLFANGMYLLGDEIQELEGDNYVCRYEAATEIREASDTERKLLVVQARDVQKKREATKKMDFKELLDVKIGTMLFAANEYADYIFRYGGHKRIEGTTNVTYQAGGCLEITHSGAHRRFHASRSSSEDSPYSKSSVGSFNNFKILRLATDEESDLYQKERLNQIELAEKMDKIRKANENAEEEKKRTELMIGTLMDDVDEEAEVRNKKQASFDSSLRPFVSKVLVSNGDGDVWRPAIFGCIAELGERYMTVGGQQWKHCIPLKGHRELLGKVFERIHIEQKDVQK
jgi:hypothetical protein